MLAGTILSNEINHVMINSIKIHFIMIHLIGFLFSVGLHTSVIVNRTDQTNSDLFLYLILFIVSIKLSESFAKKLFCLFTFIHLQICKRLRRFAISLYQQ